MNPLSGRLDFVSSLYIIAISLILQRSSDHKDPYMSSNVRPWTSHKTSAQIIKKIDLKYGDHVTEQMDDPKEAVLASARKPSAVTNFDEMTAVMTAVVPSKEHERKSSSSSRIRREEDKLKKSSRDEKPQVSRHRFLHACYSIVTCK